jgi:hypothetical protein
VTAREFLRGERMDDTMGGLIIERVWKAADGRQVCRILRTTPQLRRIGQAVQEGDQAFLATVEEAMRDALEGALTPQSG